MTTGRRASRRAASGAFAAPLTRTHAGRTDDGVPLLLHGSVRFLQWNIERGYKLPGIIEELKRIDADVIALQARCATLTRRVVATRRLVSECTASA